MAEFREMRRKRQQLSDAESIAIPFVLLGAFLGIRLVWFLPEEGFRIFTTAVTIISVLAMLLA